MLTADYHCTSKANPLYSMVRLEDIEALDRQVEVRRRKIIAADGAANYMRPFLNALTEEEFDAFYSIIWQPVNGWILWVQAVTRWIFL